MNTGRARVSADTHTRRDDELVLDMLRLRDVGMTQRRIAKVFDITEGALAGIYRRVRLELEASER